jgi:hypothetical protein
MNTVPSSSAVLLTVMTVPAMEPTALNRISPIPFEVAGKKRVTFDWQTTRCSLASPLDHAQLRPEEIWYHRDQIAAFRETARAESRLLREQYHANVQESSNIESEHAPCPMLATVHDDEMRGLEQRACPERQRRKYITLRVIYKASQHDHGERLGRIAQKCSAWATQLALLQGAYDFERAHQSESSTLRLTRLKRCATAPTNDTTRRVRPRRTAMVCG